jgi:ferritin
MLSENITKLLSEQVAREYAAAVGYGIISNMFNTRSFPGFQYWAEKSSHDEGVHAAKILRYMGDCEAEAKEILSPTSQVSLNGDDPASLMFGALELEISYLQSINAIRQAAFAEGDFATFDFLVWFTAEQIKSIAEVRTISDQLKMAGDDACAIQAIDRSLLDA